MTLGDHALEREVLALFDRQLDMLIARMGEVDASGIAAVAHSRAPPAASAPGRGRAAEAVEAASPAFARSRGAAAAAAEARAAIANILGTG